MAALAEKLPAFEGLGDAELRALLDLATLRSLPRNTILVAEGDETDAIHLILAGRVKIFLSDTAGKEVVINIQGPGEYYGEMSLEPGGRSASVMTLEPCRIAAVKMADFRAFLLRHPEFQHVLVRKLIRRVRALTRHVHDLALLDVYGRVARTLLDMAEETPEGVKIIRHKVSRQDMAKVVGASREMVSRVMKDLEERGVIETQENGSVIIKERPKND